VSVLVAAQPNSEFPDELMNYAVCTISPLTAVDFCV
jgi:hypothetical protein